MRPGLYRAEPDAPTVFNGGPLGLLAAKVRLDVLGGFRSPEFAIGVIAVPVLLFAMFGLPSARETLPAGTPEGALMMVSLACYGIVSLAIFTFGDEVAKERGRGWPRTLRATPIPTWVYLGGKAVMALVYTVLISAALGVLAASAGGVTLPIASWAGFAVAMLGGVLAFSTLGFAVAFLVRPRAASVIANLIFLPLAFFSGFFFPLSALPPVLRDVAVWLPTYHFGQLAWHRVAPATDVEAFTGIPTAGTTTHLAWVVGCAVAFGVITVVAAGREAVTRRG
jgi:ABC-2 type transport system permease protein